MERDKRMGLEQVGDDPIAGEAGDRLDRLPFATRSAELIRVVADSSPSVVAGLIGPWGSGKTSTLAMIAEQLGRADGWTTIAFNPWELNDLASLVDEFLTTLLVAVGENEPAREAISKYAAKIAPYVGLVPMVGSAGSTALTAAAGQVLGDTSLSAQRNKVVDALAQADRKVLVFIDDVDRLHGDELAVVLKLVRLVGRLPGISYVLAYDEMTVLDVLRSTDVGGASRQRALAYLDKIVQLRLDLPPVSTYRIRAMVSRGIDDITASHGIVLDEKDLSRIRDVYAACLEPSLVEPRHVKRFFGQVEAVYDLVADEVDFVDFFLITFVRVFFPSVHRRVLQSKAELTGTEFAVEKISVSERIDRWRAELVERHELERDAAERVLEILGALFRPLQNHGGGARSRSVDSGEYFDRYMYLAVPPDDFADAKVRAAIDDVLSTGTGRALDELIVAVPAASEPIVDKLVRFSPVDGDNARMLLPLAARVAALVPRGSGFLGSASLRAHGWVTELLGAASIPDPAAVLDDLGRHLTINEIAADLSRAKGDDTDDRGIPRHLVGLAAAVGERLFAALESAAAMPPSEVNIPVSWTATQWEYLASDPTPSGQAWFRDQVTGGHWPGADVVAFFVTTGISESGVETLIDVDLPGMDRWLGIDWLLERVKPEPSAKPTGRFAGGRDTGFAERRRWAHDALAGELARRSPSA